MIQVEQRQPHAEVDGKTTVVGDCFNAAVASILELPYEDVPHWVEEFWGELAEEEGGPMPWFVAFEAWARARGFWIMHYGMSDESFAEGTWVPKGYWIASVISPRNKPEDEDPNGAHAVVMCGPDLAWDPHPGPFKGEHRGFRGAVAFVPLDPSQVAA